MPPAASKPAPCSLAPWPSTGTSESEASPRPSDTEPGRRSGKRAQVAAACNECRAKKVKCTAERPSCRRCAGRHLECIWDVAPEETRSLALKRKHEEMNDENQRLSEENKQYRYENDAYRKLMDYVYSHPYADAVNIFRDMYNAPSRDPEHTLRYLQNGDLHAQRPLSNPLTDPLVLKNDHEALLDSNLKVPARPWTDVAGDGIVSHLVSIYFDRFQPFHLCWPDQGSFIDELIAGKVEGAKYCSPMLVNAICASAAFHSSHCAAVDVVLPGHDQLRKRFYDQACICFDKTSHRLSLPTVQALMLLFLYTSAAGCDRAGGMYRLAACKMYKDLRIGTKSRMQLYSFDPTGVYARAVSRAAWGLFCIESAVSITFLQPSLIPIPETPRAFIDTRDGSLVPARHSPSAADFSLDRQCSIVEIAHDLWSHPKSLTIEPGDVKDLENREMLYDRLTKVKKTIPPNLFASENARDYFFLKTWYHVVSITVYRPIVELTLSVPHLPGAPSDICLYHCNGILRDMEAWGAKRPGDLARGIPSVMFPLYVVIFTLIPMIGDNPASHEPFTHSCRLFEAIAPWWPQASALLKGARAVLAAMHVAAPAEAAAIMANSNWEPDLDLPVGWAIPQYSDLYEHITDDGDSPWHGGVELGYIMEKWATITVGSSRT